MNGSALLVVEHDADWTRWMETTQCLGPPIIALIQEREEPAFAFTARVKARIDHLSRQGAEIRQLHLLGAADWEIPTLQARLEILRKARESSPGVEIELHLDVAPVREPLRHAEQARADFAHRVGSRVSHGRPAAPPAKLIATST